MNLIGDNLIMNEFSSDSAMLVLHVEKLCALFAAVMGNEGRNTEELVENNHHKTAHNGTRTFLGSGVSIVMSP